MRDFGETSADWHKEMFLKAFSCARARDAMKILYVKHLKLVELTSRVTLFLLKKDKAMSKFAFFAVVLLKLRFFHGHYERGPSMNQTIEMCQGKPPLTQRRRCHDWSSTRTTSELLPDLLLGSRGFLLGKKTLHDWLLCWDIFD